MSRLLVLTEPTLKNGYQLAGAETFSVHNPNEAEKLLLHWIRDETQALLAIDQLIFDELPTELVARLKRAQGLYYVVIPRANFEYSPRLWQQRISEMVRQAIGVHITFKENE